jgi:tetratricopeptide (TPR) repeat protein
VRLLCVSCDVEFEAPPGAKARCPSCRRVHGLEEVRAKGKLRIGRTPMLLGLLAVALGIGGYVWWAGRTPAEMPDEVPKHPLDADDLTAFLVDRDVERRDAIDPFAVNERLRAFAQKAVAGKTGDRDRAAALFDALQEAGSNRGWVPFRGSAPESEEVRLPPSAWRAITKRSGIALSSLELSLLYVAAARAVEVPALVVEVYALPDEKTPVDPTGYFGHFAAGVFAGERWTADPILYDLHLGRRLTVPPRDRDVLDDVAAAAQVYSHRAMATLVLEGDSPRAVELVEAANRLAPHDVSILGAHGVILLATGGVQDGMDLLRRAMRRRDDAARHHDLATALLTARDEEGALREVSEALRRAPEYAAAHATLAAVHLAGGRSDQAAEEIAIARRYDPDLDMLPTLEANLALVRHDLDGALASAEEAVRRRPHDERGLLTLALIHRERGEVLAMRRALRQAVRGSHQAEELRAAIEREFGPSALEEEEEAAAGDAGPAPPASDAGAGTFRLESKVLGQGGGPNLRLGDPSKLRLGEGGGGGFNLKLR